MDLSSVDLPTLTEAVFITIAVMAWALSIWVSVKRLWQRV